MTDHPDIEAIGKNDHRAELVFFPERVIVRVHHRTPTKHDKLATTPEDRPYIPAWQLDPSVEGSWGFHTSNYISGLEDLLRSLVAHEDQPCSFDHHGCCQEHGFFGEPGECGIRKARERLGLT